MNKLLLLATFLLCLNLKGYSSGIPNQGQPTIFQKVSNIDSSVKDPVLADPKDGFKDLFERSSVKSKYETSLNPLAVRFVEDYIASDGRRLGKMKGWGKPFFDKINTIFNFHNIPVELKYLAVIESDLKSSATSIVGAAGPWQFMAPTARGFGLRVNRSVDERRDFTKSTHAAARYLSDLFHVYNDWLLVIAAYNGGPGIVNGAIRKSGSRNFWDLQNYLPAESRNHVKKFIATHYIMEGNGGMTTLTLKETEALSIQSLPATNTSHVVLKISGKFTSLAIAQAIGMNLSEFNKLNPNFDKQLSTYGSYDMKLTVDKINLFHSFKAQILEESVRLILNSTR